MDTNKTGVIRVSVGSIFVTFVLVIIISFFAGIGFGYSVVHNKWKKDAIDRCMTNRTLEWCMGRAELENW